VGSYDEKTAIWNEIKAVYMRLQHGKCMYCERQLATGPHSPIEHDMDHFRPKNRIGNWPSHSETSAVSFATGEENETGYYWLAYHPFNLGVACKICNTRMKQDFFPIAGTRGNSGDSLAALVEKEKQLLVYPLGIVDDDPEELIAFDGIVPIPATRSGHKFRRARVIIDLFQLEEREELRRDRIERLIDLDNALKCMNTGEETDRKLAMEDIRRMQDSRSRHSSCVRSACRLYQRNPIGARELFGWAREARNSTI